MAGQKTNYFFFQMLSTQFKVYTDQNKQEIPLKDISNKISVWLKHSFLQ